MTGVPTDALGAVLRALAANPELVEQVVTAARDASPEVARLPEAENRRHIAVMVAAAIAAVEHPGEPGDEVFAAAEALGADRAAQGIPIEGLLRGVHAGRIRAVDIAVERARAQRVPPEAMLDALVRFTRYAGALERHVISGHHRAELELSRTARDAHTHVLRRLLHGEAAELAEEELTRAGLRRDGRYHCVLSDVCDPVRARSLEHRLAGHGGVFGLVEGRLAGLSPRVPTIAAPDELVVVAPATPLHEVRTRYDLCLTAVLAAGDRRGVHHLADLAGETALAAQPVLADLLAEEYLGALNRTDPFHRQVVCTGLAYLDHGQRLDQAAEALHVHPNTVRYRLGKLAELTGAPPAPTTVLHTLRWWWALHTWLRR
jgi:hypothetical protein